MIKKSLFKNLKSLQNTPKQQIFTEIGLGSDKETYKRQKQIFNQKNYSDPNSVFPRNLETHIFPEINFLPNFTVQQNGKTINLTTYRYPSKMSDTKGLIYIFHGMHSHSTAGAHIAEAYAEKGYDVLAFDHRGHGRSEGIRGYVESIDQHYTDTMRFIETTSKQYNQNIPMFVTGLSMGGMTTYLVSQGNPGMFKGAIMYAPAIVPLHNKLDQNLSKHLAKYIPDKPFLPPNLLSSNRIIETCDIMTNEKYNQKNIFAKPGTPASLFEGMHRCHTTFKIYDQPFLIIQGAVDKLVEPLGAKQIMEESPSKDKEIIWYDQMWHDVWHEPEIVEIIPKAVEWVEKRCV